MRRRWGKVHCSSRGAMKMERSHAQIRRHEAYCSGNNKVAKDRARDTNVARLREIGLARTMSQGYHSNNKVVRIGEIVLTSTMGQGPLIILQRRWRDHTRKYDVMRLIALETTKLRKIVLATPMLQDSERSRLQRKCLKTIIAATRSRGLEKLFWQ